MINTYLYILFYARPQAIYYNCNCQLQIGTFFLIKNSYKEYSKKMIIIKENSYKKNLICGTNSMTGQTNRLPSSDQKIILH